MTPILISKEGTSWNDLAAYIHQINVSKGFWPSDVSSRNVGEALCLIHSELTEAYDASFLDEMDDKLVEWPAVWVEIADAVIRVLDLGGAHGVDFDTRPISVLPGVAYSSLKDDLCALHANVDYVLEAHRKLTTDEDGALLYKSFIGALLDALLVFMDKYAIPLEVIDAKVAFNTTRPYMHGKKY